MVYAFAPPRHCELIAPNQDRRCPRIFADQERFIDLERVHGAKGAALGAKGAVLELIFEDEIEARRDALIEALEKRLHRASRTHTLFTVRRALD